VRLRDALQSWAQPGMIFVHYTGARWDSVDRLAWDDVDLEAGTLVLRETKNGEDQMVVINTTTRALLESLPKPISRSQRVFRPVNKVRFNREWKRACRAARVGTECTCVGQPLDRKCRKKRRACRSTGIVPEFRFHHLRHQAATDLIARGAIGVALHAVPGQAVVLSAAAQDLPAQPWNAPTPVATLWLIEVRAPAPIGVVAGALVSLTCSRRAKVAFRTVIVWQHEPRRAREESIP